MFKWSSEWKQIHAIERKPSLTATLVFNVHDSVFGNEDLVWVNLLSWLKYYHHLLNPHAVTNRMVLFLCGRQTNVEFVQQKWMVSTSYKNELFWSIMCKAPSVWGWFSCHIELWNRAVFSFSFLLSITSVQPSHIEWTDIYNSDLADCSVGLWKNGSRRVS